MTLDKTSDRTLGYPPGKDLRPGKGPRTRNHGIPFRLTFPDPSDAGGDNIMIITVMDNVRTFSECADIISQANRRLVLEMDCSVRRVAIGVIRMNRIQRYGFENCCLRM